MSHQQKLSCFMPNLQSMYILEEPIGDKTRTRIPLQGWTKDWALGCVNSPPAARESQEAGFMQPRVHCLAHPCTCLLLYILCSEPVQ